MPDTSIKILTYNIHKGFSMGNFRFILHEIKDALRHIDADVVFLQEVHGERRITKNRLMIGLTTNNLSFLQTRSGTIMLMEKTPFINPAITVMQS